MTIATRTALRVCCVIAMACGSSQPPRSPKAAPAIVLLDPGQEPRQRLAYTPRLHAVERVEMRFKFSIDTAYTNTVLEQGQRRTEFPAIRAIARIEVTAIEPNGDARISCAIDDAQRVEDVADPRLLRAVEAEVNALKRWRATWRLSPSGAISDIAVDRSIGLRANQLASVVESMRESSVIFPVEPVGVGATWQVASRVTASGITWERKATYILRSLADKNASVDTSIVGRAGSQALRVEPNASTKLTSATTSASGEVVVPLGALVATGTTRGNSEANFLIVNRRLRITSTVRMSSEVVIVPVDAPTNSVPVPDAIPADVPAPP